MRLPIHSRPFALPFTKALQAQLDRPADAVLRDYADLQLAWVKAKAAAFRGDEPPLTGLKMIDALEDSDDVQDVYANYNVTDEIMEKLG